MDLASEDRTGCTYGEIQALPYYLFAVVSTVDVEDASNRISTVTYHKLSAFYLSSICPSWPPRGRDKGREAAIDGTKTLSESHVSGVPWPSPSGTLAGIGHGCLEIPNVDTPETLQDG